MKKYIKKMAIDDNKIEIMKRLTLKEMKEI
ncbi:hypothetical protein CPAV1605_295 [seawater metagenome]|uniref:Uncharacterized protein n=1 Tax=seawater metagenome TaxID=1561972 RepID=A0A5E8CLX0_9ZZZZ